MERKGIVRKLDQLGRVTLPMEIRRVLMWRDQDPIEICRFGRYVLLYQEGGEQPASAEGGAANPIREDLNKAAEKLSDDDMLFVLDLMDRLWPSPHGRKPMDRRCAARKRGHYEG